MFEEAGFVSAPLLNVAHAARYLGAARRTVYDLIEWGELRAVKVSGAIHIEKISLDEFKARGRLT
jgi:excisionase family DNA binding protein